MINNIIFLDLSNVSVQRQDVVIIVPCNNDIANDNIALKSMTVLMGRYVSIELDKVTDRDMGILFLKQSVGTL